MHNKIEALKGKLVVSCQALNGNPFRSSEYLAVMAEAVAAGGAGGIRANGAEDIAAIRRRVSLPIIGINKTAPSAESVYITPTFESAAEIAAVGSDIIALDATNRPRPDGCTAAELIARIKNELKLPVMADISTLDEGIAAAGAGADMIATTLAGYTSYTKKTSGPDIELLRSLLSFVDAPVVCEGRIMSPADLKLVFEAGAFAAVVGKMITNPMFITQQFIKAVR